MESEAISATDVAACLRVLARVAACSTDPALVPVRQAVAAAHRAGKKQQKSLRRDDSRGHDRALLATARRYREEIPTPDAPPAARPERGVSDSAPGGPSPFAAGPAAPVVGRTLRRTRRCYVCKAPYRDVDADYHLLCPTCATENMTRRWARCDLTGRRAVVTGGRVKIGFHTALKLLRDGASVLITTRFPHDAARRYAAVADAPRWLDRLWVHGVDFVDLPGVLSLVNAVEQRWGHLDILVNNAAQTIQRPAGYHREVSAAEASQPVGPAARIAITGGPTPTRMLTAGGATEPSIMELFPLGQCDETGEPLDLRNQNSWTLRVGDVTPREWLETHVINAFVPFLLTGRLRRALVASPFPDRYVVQVSAMEGSFSRLGKTDRHPHTNMAKASLNMLTRTVAADYASDGIYMTSVDTGWVTDERPHPSKVAEREAGFRPPLDVIDGAARVYDPIVRGVRGDRLHGVFLKDYRSVPW